MYDNHFKFYVDSCHGGHSLLINHVVLYHMVAYVVGAHERVAVEDKCGDAYEVFHCLSEQYSLESYLEAGCLKSNSDLFPYLDISKLDEDDKEDLMHQLSQNTSDMMMSFAKLLDEICVSLEKRKISVE